MTLDHHHEDEAGLATPKKRGRGRPRKDASAAASPADRLPLRQPKRPRTTAAPDEGSSGQEESPRRAFVTPTKPRPAGRDKDGVLAVRTADRSARRKSARNIIERQLAGDLSDDDNDDALAKEAALAHRIWDADAASDDAAASSDAVSSPTASAPPPPRPRGRPKGSKKARTPTPPPNQPAHERYFHAHRPGAAARSSANTLATLPAALTAATYARALHARTAADPHRPAIRRLHALHARAFPQWRLELAASFSICLYGYGSARALLAAFARHLHAAAPPHAPPTIILLNGDHPGASARGLLATLAAALDPPLAPAGAKLPAAAADLLALVLAHLAAHPPAAPLYVLVASVASAALRRGGGGGGGAGGVLAGLVGSGHVRLVASAAGGLFPLLWEAGARDRFNWLFHDATTYAPYDDGRGTGELGAVVEAVHALMGRGGARGRGRDGLRWVLASLSENARGVYRVLVAELLARGDGGGGADDDGQPDADAVPYKTLYAKAAEEFLCSSEASFRELLREFYDHEMIVARGGGGGGGGGDELLGVPLRREEMEALLEDLVG